MIRIPILLKYIFYLFDDKMIKIIDIYKIVKLNQATRRVLSNKVLKPIAISKLLQMHNI
jgi:hypothetical protein